MAFFTYLLASAPYGTLYCGHTDDLAARVWKHREKTYGGFTARYGVTRLVWYEMHHSRDVAFQRERQIKKWNRAWKVRLIEAQNPTWKDLYPEVDPAGPVPPRPLSHLQSTPLIPAKAGIQAEREEAERPLGFPPSRE